MMEPIFSPALLAMLPDASKPKALRLDEEAQAAFWAIGPTNERRDAARATWTRQRNETLNLSTAIAANNRKFQGDSERIAAAQKIEDAAKAEFDRLTDVSRQAAAYWQELVAPAQFARDWLGDKRLSSPQSGSPALLHAALPKIGNVPNLEAAVSEIRVPITAKKAEIEAIEGAPLPVEDQLARQLADIDRRAERGAPDYDARRRDKPVIDLERSFNHPSATADFIVWLHIDAIKARLKEVIGKDAPGALSDADRNKRLAQLVAEKLQLERREEALIVAAEARGQRITRRRDCDPRALLELEWWGRA